MLKYVSKRKLTRKFIAYLIINTIYQLLYPKRKTFHIDEFIKFNWIVGVYFFKIGELEKAKMYYKAISSIEPKDKHTKILKKLLYPSFLRRWLLKKKKQLDKGEIKGR